MLNFFLLNHVFLFQNVKSKFTTELKCSQSPNLEHHLPVLSKWKILIDLIWFFSIVFLNSYRKWERRGEGEELFVCLVLFHNEIKF